MPSSFSKRFDSFSMEEALLAKTLQSRKTSNLPIFDLTEANPSRAGIPLPESEILKSLGNPAALDYRPHPLGNYEAREAIAQYYRSLGKEIVPEQIVLTTGSSEAMGFLLKLLCDPGDTIAVPAPGYPLFDYLAALEGVELFRYRLRESVSEKEPSTFADWSLNRTQLEAAIPNRTRALVCVAPNNPTGSVPSESEWQFLDSFASERNLALVVDEVFRPYSLAGESLQPLKAGSAPLFTLNGLSKLLGLPQLKLGWILVEGPELWLGDALARLEIIADSYLSVATPIQTAVPHLHEMESTLRSGIQQRIQENLDLAMTLLAASTSLQPRKPRAGWYLPVALNGNMNDEAFALKLLETAGVYIHPGHLFDFARPDYIVLSLLPDPTIFKSGLQFLCDFQAS
jgi:alanine-synthesizing transaminase